MRTGWRAGLDGVGVMLLVALACRAEAQGVQAPRVGGYIQARETAQERAGLSASLNRARFSIDGSLPSAFAYRLLVETEASAGVRAPATVSLREAIVRWTPRVGCAPPPWAPTSRSLPIACGCWSKACGGSPACARCAPIS